jgi:phospholipid/cholesterol/gamma-HCH transport system permease protein
VGWAAATFWRDFRDLVTFVGAAGRAFAGAVLRPDRIRWKDTLAVAESAGANALPIVALIGTLMGLIMAFQSAIPLRRFGADIYIADMLGISMVRELGALVTAILLAGRSGSAFAAEIGTMKVNEEIDALTTMGLNPLGFLAVPRVLAAMAVTPLLTMFFNLFALAGGAVVVMGFGYSFTTYTQRVLASVTLGDVAGGLFKAFVFSILVAGIGCHRGLSTGTGARAVGASTTSSVVSGLVLIAVADGIMAVLFYMLDI